MEVVSPMHPKHEPVALLARQLFLCGAVICLFAACSDSSAPPEQKAVTPVDSATAGEIQVQVGFNGAAPAPKLINMSSTPVCANMHPDPVFEQPVDAKDGRLANVVVYIKSGFGGRAFAFPTEPVTIDQRGCLYKPRIAAVMVGQPLVFHNSDPEAHNVHGRPQVVDSWNFLMSRPNSTRTVYFDKPEVGIRVGCDVHPWMNAYVSVIDNPYFGVTGEDGTVTLKNVPPGEYTVATWHETLGTRAQQVTLAARGSAELQLTYDANPGS
jgi:plastocyanin